MVRYPLSEAAGLVNYNGQINERKFFAGLTYQDVLNLEMMPIVKSIAPGELRLQDLEAYLTKYRSEQR